MNQSLVGIPEIRRLGERGQDILQVLLEEFTLSKEKSGRLLELSIHDDLLSIADRAGKSRFFSELHRGGDVARRRLVRSLNRFERDDRLLSYRMDCSDYPLRYGNGGVLPILRHGSREYFCLFYRDAFPAGWNIANGASDSLDELLNPERIMHREFGEELLACDHDAKVVYTFRTGHDRFEREVLKYWAERKLGRNLQEYQRLPTPLKWIEGPDRIRVHYGQHSTTTADVFANITPEDNAIEVDRVALIGLHDKAVLFDGEFTRGFLYNRIVGLFEVQRTLKGLSGSEFRPDHVFYDVEQSDPRELDRLVDRYLKSLKTLRSPSDLATHPSAKNKFDLCPITRVMLNRYRDWLTMESRRPVDLEILASAPTPEDCQVFLSYRSADLAIARWLNQELVDRGFRVFCSAESLPRLGESNYAAAIDRALEKASCLVVVGTKAEHFESGWVAYEWRSFLNERLSGRRPNIQLFPFVGDVEIHQLPLALRNQTVIPFSASSPQDSFENLERYITQALKGARGDGAASRRTQPSTVRRPS